MRRLIYSILGVQLIEDFLATGWTILGKQCELLGVCSHDLSC